MYARRHSKEFKLKVVKEALQVGNKTLLAGRFEDGVKNETHLNVIKFIDLRYIQI
jgi:transposase-like protein